ncbi:hypothetical protein [Ruminococcus champanellensis]|uniref:hypothetical protein n=3 Tax=Ruminococcus champanellensis TaxID=1161942 RepID=UPI00248C9D12|nr:hypothetical protein [Ruminococcus champanellensis]
MYSYTLAREINSQLFKETCDKIEKSFPFVEKKKLLIDVDGSLLQDYFINGKKIRVQNDCDVYSVYVDSEIDLKDICNPACKNKKMLKTINFLNVSSTPFVELLFKEPKSKNC